MKLHTIIDAGTGSKDVRFKEGTSSNPLSLLGSKEVVLPKTENHDLDFSASPAPQKIPLPLKRLEGLDEIEVLTADIYCSSLRLNHEKSVGPVTVSGNGQIIKLAANSGPATLTQIEITELRVTPPIGQSYIIKADKAGSPQSAIAWRYKKDGATVETVVGIQPPGAFHLHILILPVIGSAPPGPPMAAAPFFAMPGSGAAMYGPALGGAQAFIRSGKDGTNKIIISCLPPLACEGCNVVVATTNALTPNEGLPNEAAGVAWSATLVTALFDLRPGGASVELCSSADPDGAPVASFETDPGEKPSRISFAPVARAILKKAYPVSSGSDLGLSLTITPKSAGMLRIGTTGISARYLYRPVGLETSTAAIRGDTPRIILPLKRNLRPGGFTFQLSGDYLPQRLTVGSDMTPRESLSAIRVRGDTKAACKLLLTNQEQTFPLGRCAVYGRSDSPGELLLSLHKANGERVGEQIANPVACVIEASNACSWHTFDFGASGIAAPHDGAYWLLLSSVRGAFYWHCDPSSEERFQVSKDKGFHFADMPGRPYSQLTVIDIPQGSLRKPDELLTMGWNGGVLSQDCTGIKINGFSPMHFEGSFVVNESNHHGFFDMAEAQSESLELLTSCRRDCDIALNDVVFVYYP
jgi:hypothetical protein